MQSKPGTLKPITENEAALARDKGRAGRIIEKGRTVALTNPRGTSTLAIVEGIGRRFVSLRLRTRSGFAGDEGEEATIGDCSFVVEIYARPWKTILLRGVPPSTLPGERGKL
jgi:hypothetical protein